MSKWYMDDTEIAQMYRDAADKNAQIQIIAELNLVTKQEVREKLAQLGEIKSSVPVASKKARSLRITEKQDAILREVYNRGACDDEIAAATGVPKARVTSWRAERSLKAHYKKREGKEMQKKSEAPKEEAGKTETAAAEEKTTAAEAAVAMSVKSAERMLEHIVRAGLEEALLWIDGRALDMQELRIRERDGRVVIDILTEATA